MALVIDNCHVCRQRAELMLYAPDNRMVCGECRLTLDSGAVRHLERGPAAEGADFQRHEVRRVAPQHSEEEDEEFRERELYLGVIQAGASDAWLKKFIKEVIARNILKYDWKRVLQNKRWFSTLDLRRHALDINPDFEKALDDADDDPPLRVPEEETETPGEGEKAENDN